MKTSTGSSTSSARISVIGVIVSVLVAVGATAIRRYRDSLERSEAVISSKRPIAPSQT